MLTAHRPPSTANLPPLAERMRPQTLDEFIGQDALMGPKKPLRQLLEADQAPSMIFWGPPGSGKTTLARIIAQVTKSEFFSLSAVTAGVKELKAIIEDAKERQAPGRLPAQSSKTIIFLDEIHRWNKAQQDALLPYVENGTITLIGATTENPSFEVNSALLSRARVFVLEQLTDDDITTIVKNALSDAERGLGKLKVKIDDETIAYLAGLVSGDARMALNALEFAVTAQANSKKIVITKDKIKDALGRTHVYDKGGEQHYNIISALHKSLRGSNADAALYWLARMLEAGEDPLYVARRLVRFASEDIGIANSQALVQAMIGYQACHAIGMPECNVILAQVVVYLAKCKKSNELYTAYKQAARDVQETRDEPVPIHLRNAPTKLMKELGYGRDYKYSPDYNYSEDQEYFPDSLKGTKYLA